MQTMFAKWNAAPRPFKYAVYVVVALGLLGAVLRSFGVDV